MSSLDSTDYTIVFLFIAASVSLPFLLGYLTRDKNFLQMTFAGRRLGFLSMALTMFLSENGAAQLTGLAGWAVDSGLGIYAYELMSSFGLLTLGWIFMPVYMASGVNTTIDYANKRFGGRRIGIVMVILMLFINLLSKFSVELHTAHIMLDELFELPPTIINLIMMSGAFIVVFPGGLYSLVYTNNVQFLFFVVGMPVIFVFSYDKFQSWQEIQMRYQTSWPNTTIEYSTNKEQEQYKYTHCGIPDMHALDLIRNHNDVDLPWPGMIFGIYIISVYNFCIDQSILQFCLGAKNIIHAKYACLVSSFFKVLTIFLVIPGFIARVLYTDTVACADPDVCERACGKRTGCADLALPQLFDDLVPEGWRGPVLVAFMAATLTSLAATLHAGSTIFVLNLYRPLRQGRTSEFEIKMVGKLVELVQAALGIVLVKLIDTISNMHDFMQQIYSTMVPPLVAVYLLGIFWDRVTEKNAFEALVLGSCIAFTRLAWKLSYGSVPCGDESESDVPDIIANFHDLHFAVFLFVICVCFIVISGMLTDPINVVHLRRLVYWLRHDTKKRIDINKLDTSFVKQDTTSFSNTVNVNTTVKTVNTIQSEQSEEIRTRESTEEIVSARDSFFVDNRRKRLESAVDQEMMVQFQAEVPVEPSSHEDEEQEEDAKRKPCCGGLFTINTKQLTDEDLQETMSHRTLVMEQPSETRNLNMMLVILLLVIVFVMGFFK